MSRAHEEVWRSGRSTAHLQVYEHGWQSWSPAGLYPAVGSGPRPAKALWQTMAFRPEVPAPDHGFQGEGLLAVHDLQEGTTTVVAAPDPWSAMPSVRAHASGDELLVTADGPVAITRHDLGVHDALRAWAAGLLADRPTPIRPQPPGWCSWYCHGPDVTQQDMFDVLEAADRLDLRYEVVQLDDGYQAELGDWLVRKTSAFPDPLRSLADRVTQSGRQAGIWTAPFCVGRKSDVALKHPDWLVGDAVASPTHWGQEIAVLDVTHPDAAAHLHDTFTKLTAWGFDYHKVDFLYAGAMPGRRRQDVSALDAYAIGMGIIRDAIGPAATLLGCGAPLLPSIGLVDAMRVSPDIDPAWDPPMGDVSQPSMQGALRAGRARAWQHGLLWINDPDCVLVRPQVRRRDDWAGYLSQLGGLAVASDRPQDLDPHGLALTRELLVASDGSPPSRWRPDGRDPDADRLEGED